MHEVYRPIRCSDVQRYLNFRVDGVVNEPSSGLPATRFNEAAVYAG